MSLNDALFNDNGQCGYILKPPILRDLSLGFHPNDTNTMKNKCFLNIRIISAQNLSMQKSGHEIIEDIVDPYVTINIYGVPADHCEKKTKTVKDNGFNPFWNEIFEFNINCPELAFVKFTVKDEDTGFDDFIGEYTVRFENMREGKFLFYFRFNNFYFIFKGYRHCRLKNKIHQGTLFVGISLNYKF